MTRERHVVAVTRVGTAAAQIAAAVDELLGLIGSPLDVLAPGDRVLLKPNMFQRKPGFMTNPDVVCALARRASETGAHVTVAERTRNLYPLLEGSDVHRYAKVVSLDDVPLRVTHIESATSLRVPIAIPDIVLDCDYFIGVPQVRTHASVLLSNAMKNLIGLLPGYTTRIVHMAGVDESVVDLNAMRPHHLAVADATVVVEGNYPMEGRATDVGVLAASTNAVALDVAVAHLAGFDPTEIEYLRHAHRRGLGPCSFDDVELRGLGPAEASFSMVKAPRTVHAPRPGIHLYIDGACEACRRYIAGALHLLEPELLAYDGELTILAGAMGELPPARGPVVLVGNCMYEQRDAGVYIEGCPPRAIQVAGFRWAMGQEVSPEERTQFRLPVSA